MGGSPLPEFQVRTGRTRLLTLRYPFECRAWYREGGGNPGPEYGGVICGVGFTVFAGISGYYQLWAGGKTNAVCDPGTGIPMQHGWFVPGPPDPNFYFLIQLLQPDGTWYEAYEPAPGVTCAAYKAFPRGSEVFATVSGTVTLSIQAEEWLVWNIDRQMPREQFPIPANQSGLTAEIDGIGRSKGWYMEGPQENGMYQWSITITDGHSSASGAPHGKTAAPDIQFARAFTTVAGFADRSDSQWGNPPRIGGALTACTMGGRPLDFSVIGANNRFGTPTVMIYMDADDSGNWQWSIGELVRDLYTLTMKADVYCEPKRSYELDVRVVPHYDSSYPGTVRIRNLDSSYPVTLDVPNGNAVITIPAQYSVTGLDSDTGFQWYVCDNGSVGYLAPNGVPADYPSALRLALERSWLQADKGGGWREDDRDWRLLIDDYLTVRRAKIIIPSSVLIDSMLTGWTGTGCTLSVDGDALKVVVTGEGASVSKDFGSGTEFAAHRFAAITAKGTGSFVLGVADRTFIPRTLSAEFEEHRFDLCAPSSSALVDSTDHAYLQSAIYCGPHYTQTVTITGLTAGNTYWFKDLRAVVVVRSGITPSPTWREYYDWQDSAGTMWRYWRGMYGESDGRRVLELPYRRRQLSPSGSDEFVTVSGALSLVPDSVQVETLSPPDNHERTKLLFGQLAGEPDIEAWFVTDVLYTASGRQDIDRSSEVAQTGLPVRLRFDELWVYSGFGNPDTGDRSAATPVRITKRLRMPFEGLVVDPDRNEWVPGESVELRRNATLIETVSTDVVGYYRTLSHLYRPSATFSVQTERSGEHSLPDLYPSGSYNDGTSSSGGWYAPRKRRRCVLLGAVPAEANYGSVTWRSKTNLLSIGSTSVRTYSIPELSLIRAATDTGKLLRRLRYYHGDLVAIAGNATGELDIRMSEDLGNTWSIGMSVSARTAVVETIESTGQIVVLYEAEGSQVQRRESIDRGVTWSTASNVTVGGIPLYGQLLDSTWVANASALVLLVQTASSDVKVLWSEDYGRTFTEVL